MALHGPRSYAWTGKLPIRGQESPWPLDLMTSPRISPSMMALNISVVPAPS